jgi:hypothetical protein
VIVLPSENVHSACGPRIGACDSFSSLVPRKKSGAAKARAPAPAFARDQKALRKLKAPSVGRDEAVRKLRAYWSRLGFWPLGDSGIHVVGTAQRGANGLRKKSETLAGAASNLVGRRVCENAAIAFSSLRILFSLNDL